MNVLITGSTRGLGLAIAKRLSREHDIYLHGRSVDSVASVAREICAQGWMSHDLSDQEKLLGLFDFIDRNKIDCLISNAGIYEREDSDVSTILNVNLVSPVILMRWFYRYRKECGGGTIVSINSLAGKYPNPKEPVYCASKAGLTSFVQSLQESGPKDKVSVYEFFFGAMRTDMTKHRADWSQLIDPTEAAELIRDAIATRKSLIPISQVVKRVNYG